MAIPSHDQGFSEAEPEGMRFFVPRNGSYPTRGPMADSDLNDYTARYSKDRIGEELSPQGRFWRTYLDEAANLDGSMLDEYHKTIDQLLVFAALFSAVVTTFVNTASENMKPDYSMISACLLVELVNMQRGAANSAPARVVSLPSCDTAMTSAPTYVDQVVNSIWVVSLTLSLITAFIAVVVKQWLHQYSTAIPDSSPRDRARIRQSRHAAFGTWQVPMIIGLLPVLMHTSLGLFLAGFIPYLFSMDMAIAYVVAILSGAVYVAYGICLILPFIYYDCPYKTPLTFLLYGPHLSVRKALVRMIPRRCNHLGSSSAHPLEEACSLKEAERALISKKSTVVDREAISWLYSTTSNASVQHVVVQSIIGLCTGRIDDVDHVVEDLFEQLGSLRPPAQKSILDVLESHHSLLFSDVNVQTERPIAGPFRDTTVGLVKILQTRLRNTLSLPHDMWLWILGCADPTSARALVLATELIKVWRDNFSANHLGHRLVCGTIVDYVSYPGDTLIGNVILAYVQTTAESLLRHNPRWSSIFISTRNPLNVSPTRLSPDIALLAVFCAQIQGMEHLNRDPRYLSDVEFLLRGASVTIDYTLHNSLRNVHLTRRTACYITSCRDYPSPLSRGVQQELLQLFTHCYACPFTSGWFVSDQQFCSNLMRCFLSPVPFDTPQLRDLEWIVLVKVVEPFFHSKDDAGMVSDAFEEEGGFSALYERFLQFDLAPYKVDGSSYESGPYCNEGDTTTINLARYAADRITDIEPSFCSPASPDFLDRLLLLSRILIHGQKTSTIARLLLALSGRSAPGSGVWQEFIAQLCQWTKEMEFRDQWTLLHRRVAIDIIGDMCEFLGARSESVELPQYEYVVGGKNLDVLKSEMSMSKSYLRNFLTHEGSYVFAPYLISYAEMHESDDLRPLVPLRDCLTADMRQSEEHIYVERHVSVDLPTSKNL